MSLGQAFESAEALLTVLALLPVLFLALTLSSNLNNPNLEPTQAITSLVEGLAYAMIPNIEAIFVFGVVIWAFGYFVAIAK